MKILNLDHIVLTTKNLKACIHFYTEILGIEYRENNGRHSLFWGTQKINIHSRPGEFQPAAATPMPGSLDLCFVVEGPLEAVKEELVAKGADIELGIVPRNGALGLMDSLYLRDPDNNLVELSCYRCSSELRPQ
jgi:catechol 2,3-dioxygenase-like lactoylglutathione lyase family enzyme